MSHNPKIILVYFYERLEKKRANILQENKQLINDGKVKEYQDNCLILKGMEITKMITERSLKG
jgi:hypothetical protein